MSDKQNIRQKLLKNDNMIEDQGNQLNDIERNLKETENLGLAINENLRDQRVKLVDANEKVKDTHHVLRKTDKLAGEINRRYICFKAMLIFTIFFLLLAIIIVLIIKLSKR